MVHESRRVSSSSSRQAFLSLVPECKVCKKEDSTQWPKTWKTEYYCEDFCKCKNIFFHIFGTTKKCVFCTFLKKESRKAIFFTTKNGLFLWILTHGEIPSWGCGGWVLCGGGNRSREGRGLTPRSRTLSLKNRRLTCTYQPNCICGMNSPNLGELSSPLFFFWRPYHQLLIYLAN